MKKIVLLMTLLLLVCSGASAQSNVLERMKNRAKNAAESNIGRKVEKGVNDILDGKLGKNKEKNQEQNTERQQKQKQVADQEEEMEPQEAEEQDATTQNVKNDFKRGSVILFEDTMDDEQIGEFPSKWDIVDDGSLEVAVVNGKKYAQFTTDYNRVTPLMSNPKSYLPDVFTFEWDMFISKSETETQKFGEEKRNYLAQKHS